MKVVVVSCKYETEVVDSFISRLSAFCAAYRKHFCQRLLEIFSTRTVI